MARPITLTVVTMALVASAGPAAVAGPAAPPAAARRGVVAYWDFEEASGIVVKDRAGGDNNGRLRGEQAAARFVGQGGQGRWLGMTAAGQEVSGPDRGFPTGQRPGTISVWFNRPKGVADKVLFVYGRRERGRARGLWLVKENRLCFYFWGDPKDLHADIRGGIAAGRWHHVAGTYDGRTARLYYDGRLVGQVDHKLDTALGGAFHIGRNLVADHRDYVGLIDDVAVYDRALSAEEIRREYQRVAGALRGRGGEDIRAYHAKLAEIAKAARATLAGRIADIGTDEIIFAVRQPGKDGHWYANFGYWVTDPNRKLYGPGGRLCRLNLRTGELKVLLADAQGGVRDPDVHYDGRKILFSYRKGAIPYYHLYEISADPSTSLRTGGSGLRRLTDGPFDDIEPVYLPDGDIVFGSSRCNRYVPCWSTQVAILYRCDANGRGLRPLSSNIEQENTPCVLPDGRVLYTRWEYVDRSQVDFHHLWTVNPDGTGQMTYYGNMHPGGLIIDARPIPGSNRVVAVFSPGHGRREHAGAVTIVNPDAGPDERAFARRISRGSDFRDPYPLPPSPAGGSGDLFLVARGASVLLLDARGRTTPLYTLPPADVRAGLHCHEPRPLRPRPRERVIPSRVDRTRPTGRLVLADVTYGRNMPGVRRGEIKKLLVLECLPEPVNFNGAYPYEISWMEPVSLGGTFALARVLGTVPVEADGSAHFDVPALRSLFFVALDERSLSVKRMQSFVTLQPGETTSCVGCHEARTQTSPSASRLLATRRRASRIQPFDGIPDVPDFPRDIQPILDRHCVRCHNPDRRDGRVDLAGDRTPVYSQSYWTLIKRRLVADGRNQRSGNRPPRTMGTSASRLMKLIDGSHYEAKLTDRERTSVRLWIEVGAPYAGTYAAYFSGMAAVKFPVKAMTRRCGPCHAARPGKHRKQAWEGHDIRPWARLPLEFAEAGPAPSVCNLTRPAKSPLLLAPLSRKAGGYGLCGPRGRKGDGPLFCEAPFGPATPGKGVRPLFFPVARTPAVFADTRDPDYATILAAIGNAAAKLDRIKRFDMPGFRPNVHYVREMKRFGILPAGLGPKDPIDAYAADRAYWRSFWYTPAVGTAGE